MQGRPVVSPEVNIFVANYDRCLFGIQGTHRFMLSYPLVEFANQKIVSLATESLDEASSEDDSELDCTNYNQLGLSAPVDFSHEKFKNKFQGFYGFSNRAINTLPRILDSNLKRLDALREAGDTIYEADCLRENFPTYKITQNFAMETGLRCLGVSTAEDYQSNLGDGYHAKIKPWEMADLNLNKKPKNPAPFSVLNDVDQRAYRLTQIARNAADNYPHARIRLTYVNDSEKQCHEAVDVPNSKKHKRQWPANVKIEVYQHEATGNEALIHYVGLAEKVTKPRALPMEHVDTAALRTSGLFAPAAMKRHAMTTRSDAAKMRRLG